MLKAYFFGEMSEGEDGDFETDGEPPPTAAGGGADQAGICEQAPGGEAQDSWPPGAKAP